MQEFEDDIDWAAAIKAIDQVEKSKFGDYSFKDVSPFGCVTASTDALLTLPDHKC